MALSAHISATTIHKRLGGIGGAMSGDCTEFDSLNYRVLVSQQLHVLRGTMRFATVIVLFCATLIAPNFNPAWAQSTTGNIAGKITDPSGAPIAGAKVAAINVETNVARSTTSLQDGSYSLLFLPVGTYK